MSLEDKLLRMREIITTLRIERDNSDSSPNDVLAMNIKDKEQRQELKELLVDAEVIKADPVLIVEAKELVA